MDLPERIIWNKVTGGSDRFGTTGQHPHPTYHYSNQQHEEIQVWRKGDVERRKDPASKLAITGVMKQEIVNNVWHVARVPTTGSRPSLQLPGGDGPPADAAVSCNGDNVADPTAGSGTTPFVADRLGRDGLGLKSRGK